MTADDIREMSTRIATDLSMSKGDVQDAALKIATFKSIGANMYEEIIRASQSLADAGFGEFSGNIIQMGKALESPTSGMTALARSGVTFSAAEKDIITQLEAIGNKSQAQIILLNAVNGQVKGVGEAVAAGYGASVYQLDKQMGFAKKAFNSALLAPMEKANNALAAFWKGINATGAASKFASAVGNAFNYVLDAALSLVDKIDFDSLADNINGSGERIGKYVRDIGGYFDELVEKWKADNAVIVGVTRITVAAWGVFKGIVQFAGAGAAAIAQGYAKLVQYEHEGLAKIGAEGKEQAKEWERTAGGFGQVADDLIAASDKSLASVGRDFTGAGDAADDASSKVGGLKNKTTELEKSAAAAAKTLEEEARAVREAKAAMDAAAATDALKNKMLGIVTAGEAALAIFKKIADANKGMEEKIAAADDRIANRTKEQIARNEIQIAQRLAAEGKPIESAKHAARAQDAISGMLDEAQTTLDKYRAESLLAQVQDIAQKGIAQPEVRRAIDGATNDSTSAKSRALQQAINADPSKVDEENRAGQKYSDVAQAIDTAQQSFNAANLASKMPASEAAAQAKARADALRQRAGIVYQAAPAEPTQDAKRPSGPASLQFPPGATDAQGNPIRPKDQPSGMRVSWISSGSISF